MKSFFTKELFGHPIVMSAIGAVALIAIGSGIYYFVATRPPSLQWAQAATGSITETVIGSGTVEPAENPNLAFVSGGRVSAVNVSVGAHVYAGEVLASLDTAALSAQEKQAEANVAAAQARLDEMQAGPQPTDLAPGQTALAQAQQSLDNAYASVPATLTDAYNKAYNGVRQSTDALFSSPTSAQPTVAFQTTDSQSAVSVQNARVGLNAQFPQWQSKLATSGTDKNSTDQALAYSIAQLTAVRSYTSVLLQALANAVPSGTLSATAIANAQTSIGALNQTVSGLILSLQNTQQQIASAHLSVQSAQDSLNKINAGDTPQSIEAQQAQVQAAQAQVASVQAQIANNLVIAPFSGTVASVSVKSGQTVDANTVAVSLTPASALQVELYVSELDVAKLTSSSTASVTLDAYGSGRSFPAKVASVDRAPTSNDGKMLGYKIVLQFASNDPAISVGMGANATITAAQKQDVLVIQKTAVLQNGSQTFVLVPGQKAPVQREIETGISDATHVEVLSGLTTGEQYLVNAQ